MRTVPGHAATTLLTTTLLTTTLLGAGLLTGSLAAGAAAVTAEPTQTTTTTHERGHVLECTGTWRTRPVFASVYENSEFGHEVFVHVGDDGDEVGATRRPTTPMIEDGEVAAWVRLDGRRARLTGTAERFGKRIAVHEEFDDAGQHVVVDGFHKRLAAALTMTWRKKTVPLSCDTAFRYDLTVEKTPVE